MTKFKYTVDEFADAKVLRYKVDDFAKLSFKQKEYIYYLSLATLVGRDIIWDQKYHYNIIIRKSIEAILQSYKGNRSAKLYNMFLEYAKTIFFHKGVYHEYSREKIIPKISQEYFKKLILESDEKLLPYKKDKDQFIKLLLDVIYNIESSDDILLNNPTNFYEYVTSFMAKDYYEEMIDRSDKSPISYGLNSKLKNIDGELVEEVYKINGKYSEIIEQIIYWLEKAYLVAENKHQQEYTKLLIEYYKTGDLNIWDQYNIAWVKDDNSIIDYINGFIEVYNDPIGYKASWEAIVNFKDEESSIITEKLSENAFWFEQNSPIDNEFKKTKVTGISAKVINAVMIGGDAYLTSLIGFNLPNSDWIRTKYGSKSVTIGNFTKAIEYAREETPRSSRKEFIYQKEDLLLSEKYSYLANDIHTHLHECLGHASGLIQDKVSQNALGEYAGAIEEARAELFALYYLMDDKMIELNLIPNKDVAKCAYNTYIRVGLQIQLARVELGKNITQAHMQARKLISEYAFIHGKKDKVITKKIENKKTYFIINDYEKLRGLFAQLLKIIQKIKSIGDFEAAKELIEIYGKKIDYKLHQETIERYNKLKIKPYTGFMNPEIKPIIKNNKVVDYKIIYCNDYLKQQLNYGKYYSYIEKFEE